MREFRAAFDAEVFVPPAAPDPDTIPDPGPLPPGSRMIFSRNANFTGRADHLKALARGLLRGEEATLVTQAVHGPEGVGKTQLAVEFAHRYGRFLHGVHWINAAQPEAIEEEIARCGAKMAAAREAPFPEERPDQTAWTLAAWRQGGPRLVVLDNLEEVEAARRWLGELSGGPMRVLVTARRRDWPSDTGLRTRALDPFTPGESRDFLRDHLAVERASLVELDALAKRLGHLPSALELAGRYLARQRRMGVAGYVDELEAVLAHPSMRSWREALGNPTGHDLDVLATFAVSWNEVRDETARPVFLLAGHCVPNEPIPGELLETAAGLDQAARDDALSHLSGLGLVDWVDTDGVALIHPLLAAFARAVAGQLAQEEGDVALLPALAEALAWIAERANRQMDETGSPSHFLPLVPHVRLVARTAEGREAESAARLWNSLGYHLDAVADHEGARGAYERAVATNKAIWGPQHPEVAISLNNLGTVQHRLGDLAGAREALERALAINQAACGPEHPEVAISAGNLGLALKDLGDLAGAREAFERALAVDEAVYGLQHPAVAGDVNNLGLVLYELGDLGGARKAFERALAVDEAVIGPEHPAVATDLNILGLVLCELGDLLGAREAFERALAILEGSQLPPDDPTIKTVRENLTRVQATEEGQQPGGGAEGVEDREVLDNE